MDRVGFKRIYRTGHYGKTLLLATGLRPDERVRTLVIQDEGGTRATVEKGAAMDMDCRKVLDAGLSIAQMGAQIFDRVLETASAERPKANWRPRDSGSFIPGTSGPKYER
jgi:altronate dehydratase